MCATYHGPRPDLLSGARERYHKLSGEPVHEVTDHDESHVVSCKTPGHMRVIGAALKVTDSSKQRRTHDSDAADVPPQGRRARAGGRAREEASSSYAAARRATAAASDPTATRFACERPLLPDLDGHRAVSWE